VLHETDDVTAGAPASQSTLSVGYKPADSSRTVRTADQCNTSTTRSWTCRRLRWRLSLHSKPQSFADTCHLLTYLVLTSVSDQDCCAPASQYVFLFDFLSSKRQCDHY